MIRRYRIDLENSNPKRILKERTIPTFKKKEKLLEEIWLIKDPTNGRFGKGAQIKRECIVFADPEILIPRSPKGSIRRSAAMELDAKELCSL